MKNPQRELLLIDFMQQGEPRKTTFEFQDLKFVVHEFRIGWNFSKAREILQAKLSLVDGVVFSGVRENVGFGKVRLSYGPGERLLKETGDVPYYLDDELQILFSNWSLKRLSAEQPSLFKGKKVLLHSALLTHFTSFFQDAGAKISSLDANLMLGIEKTLTGKKQITVFAQLLRLPLKSEILEKYHVFPKNTRQTLTGFISSQIRKNEVFVTYAGLLKNLDNVECLRGKILVIDKLLPGWKQKLLDAGVAQIVEWTPNLEQFPHPYFQSLPMLSGIIDQVRVSSGATEDFSQFALKFVERENISPKPNTLLFEGVRRCAFVIHPFAINQLSYAPGMAWLRKSPKIIQKSMERGLAHLPIFQYGKITGIKSESTGQEVICDLYALTMTPKQMLRLDAESVYKQLVAAAEHAHKNGALLIGLGAYTKVVGDAGVTVAKRSPIPVTTGNSYSAASTLWAAREVVEKLGFVKKQSDKKLDATAMVIGATGSIGRVSALLLALAFRKVVLVATRPEKLLELRDEILALSPNTEVAVRTNPNDEIVTTDLIVTATSNQNGRILDIQKVKPGAVICDCSRPLDISHEEAESRPDILVIESGEIDLPGEVNLTVDIGLPKPSVYACLAETVLLTLEGRYESFSLSRHLYLERVKEIYKIGLKHGAKLSEIRGHKGSVTEEDIAKVRQIATQTLLNWKP